MSTRYEFAPGKCPNFVPVANYPNQCAQCGMGTGSHPPPPKKLSEQVAQMEADLAAARAQFAERADACKRYEAEKTRWTRNPNGYDRAQAELESARANIQRLEKALAESNKTGTAALERANRLTDRLGDALEDRVKLERAARFLTDRLSVEQEDRVKLERAARFLIVRLDEMIPRGRYELSMNAQAALTDMQRILERIAERNRPPFEPKPSTLPQRTQDKLAAIRQVEAAGKKWIGNDFTLADAKKALDAVGGALPTVAADRLRLNRTEWRKRLDERKAMSKVPAKPMLAPPRETPPPTCNCGVCTRERMLKVLRGT